MQLDALRARHARVAFHHMNHRGRLGVADVPDRRLLPVRVEIVVRELVAQIVLTISLHVALGVHRDPVRRAGAAGNALEAIGVRKNPVAPVAAGAPAQHTHLGLVDQALRNERIDTGHDVVVARLEVVAHDAVLVRFAVVGGAAIVGHQHRPALPRVHLRAVAPVERQLICGRRTAVNGHDERILLARLITDRLEQHAAHLPAVLRRPRDFSFFAEGELLTDPRVGVGERRPGAARRECGE